MKRKITINGLEGRWDTPFFILTDNDPLVIEITLPALTNGIYRFIATHGTQKKHVTLGHKATVELSADWLKQGGTVSICSQLQYCDKTGTVVYKTYDIEPLEIQECEVGMAYYASVQKVQAACTEFRSLIDTLLAELTSVKAELANVPAQIEEAKRMAIVEATGGDPINA